MPMVHQEMILDMLMSPQFGMYGGGGGGDGGGDGSGGGAEGGNGGKLGELCAKVAAI